MKVILSVDLPPREVKAAPTLFACFKREEEEKADDSIDKRTDRQIYIFEKR